jgi:hypothetical protein
MTFIGVMLTLLVAGLALLLAREAKLRRALQALVHRLLSKLAEVAAPPGDHQSGRGRSPTQSQRR